MKTEHREPALPAHWTQTVKSSVLHAMSLAKYVLVYNRGWAADSPSRRVRDKAKQDQSDARAELLAEQMRIKDVRMGLLDSRHRPHYPPQERMAILQMKTAQNWSLEHTANVFQVTPATVASWMKRIDEDGPDALVQLPGTGQQVPRVRSALRTAGENHVARRWARRRSRRRWPARACTWARRPWVGC